MICFSSFWGARRGFSPRAAARHSQHARVHTDLHQKLLFFLFLDISLWTHEYLWRIRYVEADVKFSRHQPADVKILKKDKFAILGEKTVPQENLTSSG